MREFKLLKDVPDLKAGLMFKNDGENSEVYWCVEIKNYCYPRRIVENNPEWFEEIIEVVPYQPKLDMIRISIKRMLNENAMLKLQHKYGIDLCIAESKNYQQYVDSHIILIAKFKQFKV